MKSGLLCTIIGRGAAEYFAELSSVIVLIAKTALHRHLRDSEIWIAKQCTGEVQPLAYDIIHGCGQVVAGEDTLKLASRQIGFIRHRLQGNGL